MTSKLWVDHFTYEKAKQGIDDSLRKLGLDYLDLYLLHQPYGDVAGAWRALEEAQQAGKIRSIGVSNFAPDQLINLELMSNVKPAVNQIEVSPWYQEKDEVRFAQEQDVQVEAWAPFAEGKHHIFTDPTIAAIGEKYGKTNGQVILRWLLQRGHRRHSEVGAQGAHGRELRRLRLRAQRRGHGHDGQPRQAREPVLRSPRSDGHREHLRPEPARAALLNGIYPRLCQVRNVVVRDVAMLTPNATTFHVNHWLLAL